MNMPRMVVLVLMLSGSLLAQTNLQKRPNGQLTPASSPIVVGDGQSISATGTGVIAATSAATAASVPASGITGLFSTINSAATLSWKNAAGTTVTTLRPDDNALGSGITGGAGRWFIGTNAASTDDSAILIGRGLLGSYVTGAHGIRDETTYTASGAGLYAYASYDSIPTFNGSAHYNHLHSFQARPQYNGGGVIDAIRGFTFQLTHNGAGSATVNGLYIADALGVGPIAFNAGIYIESLTRGSSNYAIYSNGTQASYFGGQVQSGVKFIAPTARFTDFTSTYGQILSIDTSGDLLGNPNLTIINGVLTMAYSTAKIDATGTNTFQLATLAPFTVGGKTINGAGRLLIGANASSGDDSALLVTRAITGSIDTGAHAVRDESTVAMTGTGLMAYTSFDAIPVVSGSAAYSHTRGFQARLNYSGSTTNSEVASFFSQSTIASGTVANGYGLRIDRTLGAGAVTFYAGITIGDINNSAGAGGVVTPGTTYAIYSNNTAASYFGGGLQSGGLINGVTLKVSGLGAANYGEIWGDDGSGNLLANPNLTIINGVLTMAYSTAKILASATDLQLESTSGNVLVRPAGATVGTFASTGLTLTGALTTGAPTAGSAAALKGGAIVAGAGLLVSTTAGWRINVGGTDYTVALLTTNP